MAEEKVTEPTKRPSDIVFESHHKCVATWVTNSDYELLVKLSEFNRVRLAVYIRAIIVDALAEERSLVT